MKLADAIACLDLGIATTKTMNLKRSFAVIDGLVGAIGVSGASAQQDEEFARHAAGS